MNKIILVFLILFFLLGIIQPIYSLGKILLFGKLFDFGFYYRAGKAALSGISPYTSHYVVEGESIVLNYPPPALFLFTPFAILSLLYSQIAWTIFSVICLGLSIWFSLKCLNLQLRLGDFLLLIPLITLAFPVKWTLGMGQVNNVILLFLVLTFCFYTRRRYLLSGIFLGLGILLKLTPIYLLILFLIKKKWKITFFSLTTVLLLTLLASFLFGFDSTFEYVFRIVPSLFGGAGKEIYYNQSISGLIARLVADNNLRFYLSSFFSLLILGTSYCFLAKKEELTSLDYALLITASLLANSYSWQHHFVWLIFPFFVALAILRKKRSNYVLGPLLLSYLLIAFNIKNPAMLEGHLLEPFILSHVFFGTLILYSLLFYLMQRKLSLK